MTRIATLFLARGNDFLAVFFGRAFSIMVIACMRLPLGIVDASAVTATFIRAATATVVPTFSSTGLNTRNLLVQLVL